MRSAHWNCVQILPHQGKIKFLMVYRIFQQSNTSLIPEVNGSINGMDICHHHPPFYKRRPKQPCQLSPNCSDTLCGEALHKAVAHWLNIFRCLSNIVDITSQRFSWNTLHKHWDIIEDAQTVHTWWQLNLNKNSDSNRCLSSSHLDSGVTSSWLDVHSAPNFRS